MDGWVKNLRPVSVLWWAVPGDNSESSSLESVESVSRWSVSRGRVRVVFREIGFVGSILAPLKGLETSR